MLIIQSLFSRLRNIKTRNRGRIVIPASAPPARERPRCGWIMIGCLYSKGGEGWMRPTFVLQHLHFLVSLLIHTQAVRKGKFGSDLVVADIKTNMAQDSAAQQILQFTFATARSYFMSNNEKC